MEVDDDSARNPGVPNPTAATAATGRVAMRIAKKQERKSARDAIRAVWTGAEKTQEILMNRLPDASECVAFVMAVMDKAEELELIE